MVEEFAPELDRHVPSSFGITSSFNYFITRILDSSHSPGKDEVDKENNSLSIYLVT